MCVSGFETSNEVLRVVNMQKILFSHTFLKKKHYLFYNLFDHLFFYHLFCNLFLYRTHHLQDHPESCPKHDFRGNKSRYEQSSQEHHDHLIDINTGEITEFVNKDIEKLQKQVAGKLGYKLVDHRLELYGIKIKK